ncbi:hypothetical protein FEM48_Zijuj05G0109500 [Ziziphus jujuba var. spinosa]|uniref:Uncharacterized protein n=1 Tax=Ziziphus jujuba var. spinosa TaxID=714518 RepID=A0A978VEJ9_ZIZJJ|nr:hypothetical protein FEM48_Zijuj05G0109500 [Ziziphus jujuba var. spinosa]
MVGGASRWGLIRIMAGTILGGVFGFYIMHQVEISYKVSVLHPIFKHSCLEKMNERLKKYESELKKKEKMNELKESM